MTACEWAYKYILKGKRFNIAIIKNVSWAKNKRNEFKLPLVLIEYKTAEGCWKNIGLIK
jgi:hypothetical protein